MTIKTSAVPAQSLTLTDQFKNALDLVTRSSAIKIIKTAQEYESARDNYKALIQHEKELDKQYDALQCVIEAKIAQAQKKDLAAKFDAAKKYLKNYPMLVYERAEEEKRQAEQRRLQAEAQRLADIETAKQISEQKRLFDIAENERKAREVEQAKAEAAAKAAAKKGNEEAAAKAREKAALAEQAAAAAAAAAAQAKQDALDIKATPIVVPVVVVEKTAPSVTRRTIPKFRYLDKFGNRINEDMANSIELIPMQYRSVDSVKIGGVVRSLRANHGIPGIEYYEELV